jgi:hypothetical protein
MTDPSILTQLPLWPDGLLPPKRAENKPNLHTFWQHPEQLPLAAAESPTVRRCLDLLGPLDWGHFPERDLERNWGRPQIPYAALAAAELIKLNDGLASMGVLYRYLLEHPGFIPALGFPLVPAPNHPLHFNARASLPTERHFTYLLRQMPNTAPQFLLADSIRLILAEVAARHLPPPECVSLDTKHILAWVKENNPKAYVSDRFNKARQPLGDPDCRLGCKRKRNVPLPDGMPTRNPRPASSLKRGEFYWGYASGVVVTKLPGWGEFVLAEWTQPFDQNDLTYFFPLMRQTEDHLGYRPRFGAFDAAFDAW